MAAGRDRFLAGLSVCMLVTNDVKRDTRVRREAGCLAQAGASVTVIGVGDAPETIREDGYTIQLIDRAGVSDARIWIIRVSANLLSFTRHERRFARAARAQGANAYHCHDLNTLWIGARAAGHAARLVYDSHELYLEQSRIRGWYRSLLARREAKLSRRADLVITVNEMIARELVNRYGIAPPLVVHNGPDRCASPRPTSARLRVFFQGSYGIEGGRLRELVEAVGSVRDLVHLTLQGYGPREAELRRLVEEMDLGSSVTFLPPCAPEDTAREAANHDVGVLAYQPQSLNSFMSSPNKLFSYLGGALAIASPDIPVVRRMIDNYGCGRVLAQMTAGEISAALVWFAEHPEEVAKMKQGAARACLDYSWARQAEALVAAYSSLMGTVPPR